MIHPCEQFDSIIDQHHEMQFKNNHSFEYWRSWKVLQEDQRRTQQHRNLWAICTCEFHFIHHSFIFNSTNLLFPFQDESFRSFLAAMEQGNVKRLQIISLIVFTITSSFSFPLSCDLSGSITLQMMKEISLFLSQDGIVLEELDLGLNEKEILHLTTKQDSTILEMRVALFSLKDWKRTNHWKNWILTVLFLNNISLLNIFQIVELLLKEWKQLQVFFLMMELFLRNWI